MSITSSFPNPGVNFNIQSQEEQPSPKELKSILKNENSEKKPSRSVQFSEVQEIKTIPSRKQLDEAALKEKESNVLLPQNGPRRDRKKTTMQKKVENALAGLSGSMPQGGSTTRKRVMAAIKNNRLISQ